jgi:hypothetical protein
MDHPCHSKTNYAPLFCGLFILTVLVIFNIYSYHSSYQKYRTTTGYSRWSRQMTTWNAYLSGILLVLGTVGLKNKHVNFIRLSAALVIYGLFTNWFVLSARWYWFRLPRYNMPLHYLLADLWFHFCIPVVYTYFAFVLFINSCSESVKSVQEIIIAIMLFMITIVIWYMTNVGVYNINKKKFPWPYPNGAGILHKDNEEKVEPEYSKLLVSILNILAVVMYGVFFWITVPRNELKVKL